MVALIHGHTNLIAGLKDIWKETVGEPEICVAVLDGSVDLSHSSLGGASLTQLDPLFQTFLLKVRQLNTALTLPVSSLVSTIVR